MKVIRLLSKRGNSWHVSIPPQIVERCRWRTTDGIVVELTENDEVLLRRVRPADLGAAPVTAMNLNLPAPSAK